MMIYHPQQMWSKRRFIPLIYIERHQDAANSHIFLNLAVAAIPIDRPAAGLQWK